MAKTVTEHVQMCMAEASSPGCADAVTGAARREGEEVAAAALCTESSSARAKHVAISYKALARVGDGSGSSLVNLKAQGCANGNAVVLMPLTLPAVSLHAAMGISWFALSKLICPIPSAECFRWQSTRQQIAWGVAYPERLRNRWWLTMTS
ncbi:MAG: hypothetical protein FRX49_07168 [Trebouxia sp. A1-2]|nr:MAG: hypothetical protein FRX49_07168 [Trebouxia sp. A1-2]